MITNLNGKNVPESEFDADYKEFLASIEGLPVVEPEPSPEERLDAHDQSIDEIYLVLADMLGGADNGI